MDVVGCAETIWQMLALGESLQLQESKNRSLRPATSLPSRLRERHAWEELMKALINASSAQLCGDVSCSSRTRTHNFRVYAG